VRACGGGVQLPGRWAGTGNVPEYVTRRYELLGITQPQPPQAHAGAPPAVLQEATAPASPATHYNPLYLPVAAAADAGPGAAGGPSRKRADEDEDDEDEPPPPQPAVARPPGSAGVKPEFTGLEAVMPPAPPGV